MSVTPTDRFLFDMQGYLLLKGVLTACECDQLRALLRRLEALDYRDDWLSEATPGREPTRRTKHEQMPRLQLSGLLRLDPGFDHLLDHPRVLPYLEEFLDRPQLCNAWSICKGAGCWEGAWHRALGPAHYWVRDGRIQTTMITVIYALDDQGPADGGLMALPGSHKNHFELDLQARAGEAVPGMQVIPAKAGDVIVLSECLLHNGGAKTTPGTRSNLHFGFISNHYNIMTHEPEHNRHYCMPAPVRDRLTPRRRAMTRWMEFARPVEAPAPQLSSAL
jgi:hypothetical protein